MVCFEKKQKWKNLHELWTAPNLIVACLEFLWIDLMLDYVLQWKGIWYYRYDMACCLQFTEAGSLMGIGLHYYCDCPQIPYDVLSLVLLYRSAFVEECMCQSLQTDQGNLMIIQCIYFYWDSVSAFNQKLNSSLSVWAYNENKNSINYADWIIEIISIMEMISVL